MIIKLSITVTNEDSCTGVILSRLYGFENHDESATHDWQKQVIELLETIDRNYGTTTQDTERIKGSEESI